MSSSALSTSPKAIWQLTWPQVVMTYIVFVMTLVPILAAGHLSAGIQAALGMVVQCNLFLTVLSMGLAAGATAAISQALGAKEPVLAKQYIAATLAISALLGLGMALCGLAWKEEILHLVRLPESALPVARELFGIYMLGLPFVYIYSASGVIFRSTREVIIPLLVMALVALLQAFLCFGTSFGLFGLPCLGFKGIAMANVAANILGSFVNCLLLIKKGYIERSSRLSVSWAKERLPYLLGVTMPACLSNAVWHSGYLVLFVLTASVPLDSVFALAGLTAGLRIEGFLFMPAMAFSMSASIMVGNCLGAKDRANARRTANSLLYSAVIMMSIIACIIWPFRTELAHVLSTDPDTCRYIVTYLDYNLVSTPFSIASTVLGGVMTGAGATKINFLVFGCTIWLIRLPLGYLLGHVVMQDASGIFLAMMLSQMVQAGIMFFLFKRDGWMDYAMYKDKPSCT